MMFGAVPKSTVLVLFKEWLDLTEICKLDTAVCDSRNRPVLLGYFAFCDFTVSFLNKTPYSVGSVYWMLKRNVKGTKVFLTTKDKDYGSFDVFSKFNNSVNLYSKLEEMRIECDLVELESDHSYVYILQSMIKLCLKLSKLELLNCFLMDEMTLKPIMKSCSGLRVLKMANLPLLMDDGMFIIAQAVKLLEVFELCDTLNITSKGVEKVMKENVFAHTLILRDNEDLCSGEDKLTLQSAGCLKDVRIYFPISGSFSAKNVNLQCKVETVTTNTIDILSFLPTATTLRVVSIDGHRTVKPANHNQYYYHQNNIQVTPNNNITTLNIDCTSSINTATHLYGHQFFLQPVVVFKATPHLVSLKIAPLQYTLDHWIVHGILLGLKQLKFLHLSAPVTTTQSSTVGGFVQNHHTQRYRYQHQQGHILSLDDQKYKADLDTLELSDDNALFTDAILLTILDLFATVQKVNVKGANLNMGEEVTALVIKLHAEPEVRKWTT